MGSTPAASLGALERDGDARARRAASRWQRARVVRPRGPAPAAPGLPGGAAQGGRAGRPARAREVPARRGRASTAGRAGTGSGAGVDRLREVLVPLQGLALPPEVWERDVLPRRAGAYSPAWIDQLCAAGEVVWIGAGALGRNSGRVVLYFREDLRSARPAGAERGRGPRDGLAGARRGPRAAGRRRVLLHRPARRRRPRARGAPGRAVGSRLGGRGDQRRVRAAARAAADAGPGATRARPRQRARGRVDLRRAGVARERRRRCRAAGR